MSFKPFLAYSASAGSGKTFALSARYVSLLFMGELPSHILAATFTNKAAAQMRQRVIDSLKDLGSNSAFLDVVSSQSGFSKDELMKMKSSVLERFLNSPSYIVTLDSFFVSILRSASLELGLEPDFVTKEQKESKLDYEFVSEVVVNGDISSLVKLALDIEDKRFGKIFEIMQDFYRLDPLLSYEVEDSFNIYALESQIEKIRDALYKLLIEAKVSKSAIANFAFADIKTLSQKSVFAKESLQDHRYYKKYIQKYPAIEELYQELRAKLKDWFKAKEHIVLSALFDNYTHYKNALISQAKATKELSFDDLSYFTYRLLYESITKEFLYFKLDAKFRHILLDEFQDTSTMQYLMLKPLIDEIFSGIGQSDFRSFFYVGDKKQSLYRFRGGVEELFDKVARDYGIDIELMDTNYRSAKHIVEFVNKCFEGVMEDYTPQKSKPEAIDGYVEVIESNEVIECAITEAKKLLDMGVSENDIAFLVSANKDGVALQEACFKQGINTLLKTTSSLKNNAKIASLVAMVEYLLYGYEIDLSAFDSRLEIDLKSIDFSWFDATMTPFEVLDRLINICGYYDGDANLLRLLEFALGYDDLVEFIDEFSSSNIALASNTTNGAKIMTIHGSKGLEFEHVIVLDKLTKPKNDTNAIILGYDDELNIEKIYYRQKNKDIFDSQYAKVIAQNKILSRKDSLNVLYVAFTRAVESMRIVKKTTDSVFDMIGLKPVVLGSMSVASSQDTTLAHSKPISYKLNYHGEQDRAKKIDKYDSKEALFGSAMHYMLEMIDFDSPNIDEAHSAMYQKYANKLNTDDMNNIKSRVKMLLADEEFMSQIKGAKLYKELPLSFGGEIKQIDLLAEFEDKMIVFDYKSSSKNHISHQNQVISYKKAIHSLTNKPIFGVIVYLNEENIELSLI